MLKSRKKESMPERLNPGDREPEYCAPGSIEQELDMCESGSLRGDDVSHRINIVNREQENPELDLVLGENFSPDLAEEYREGDEMSGDEHSSGYQGDESELRFQPHISNGMPGDLSRHISEIEARESFLSEELEAPPANEEIDFEVEYRGGEKRIKARKARS